MTLPPVAKVDGTQAEDKEFESKQIIELMLSHSQRMGKAMKSAARQAEAKKAADAVVSQLAIKNLRNRPSHSAMALAMHSQPGLSTE
jgi:hypothetical protein